MHSRRRAGPPVRIYTRTTLNHQEIHLRGTASMAHEIETFDDGTAAFFTARQDAWHRLGVVTTDCLTAEDVMTTARLGGWNVRTVGLTATDLTEHGGTNLTVADHFATVLTHPTTGQPDVLGVVGAGYTVVQNEQQAELLNLLVDEAGAH